MLRLADKQNIVGEVAAVASSALSVLAAEYRGLTSAEMTSLHTQARQQQVDLRVVRNTLAKRALSGTAFDCLSSQLKGPLVLAFSKEDPGAAARVFRDFMKGNDKLVVRALSLGGNVIPGSGLNAVADLPTREQAISMLMSVMQAPITKFVRTLAEPHAKLVRTIAAVRDKKERGE